MKRNNKQYIIVKISSDSAKQINPNTKFSRAVTLKSVNDIAKDNTQKGVWHWQRSNGSYSPYDDYVSSQLNKLPIGKIHTITVTNTKYNIKKLSHNKCQQTNVQTHSSRYVIRTNITTENNQNDNHSSETKNDDDDEIGDLHQITVNNNSGINHTIVLFQTNPDKILHSLFCISRSVTDKCFYVFKCRLQWCFKNR
eukprot:399751_1